MRQQCPYWTPQGNKKPSARNGLLLELLASEVQESLNTTGYISLMVSLQDFTVGLLLRYHILELYST